MRTLLKSVMGTAGITAFALSTLVASAAGVSVGSAVNGNVNVSVPVSASVNTGVSVTSATSSTDADGMMGVTSTASGSSADSHIQSAVSSDSSITGGSASNDSVSVSYKSSGKFLGFIPVTVRSNAWADASGDVKISHPWYDFLTTTDDSAAQAQLQSQVSPYAAAQASNGSFSASAQVSVFDQLHSAIKSWMNAKASADENISTNVSY